MKTTNTNCGVSCNTQFRNTFGIIDPKTKKIYSDIKNYFIREFIVDKSFLNVKELKQETFYNGTRIPFRVLMDFKLRETLKKLNIGNSVHIVVSFQEKHMGTDIAICRIFDNNRKKRALKK